MGAKMNTFLGTLAGAALGNIATTVVIPWKLLINIGKENGKRTLRRALLDLPSLLGHLIISPIRAAIGIPYALLKASTATTNNESFEKNFLAHFRNESGLDNTLDQLRFDKMEVKTASIEEVTSKLGNDQKKPPAPWSTLKQGSKVQPAKSAPVSPTQTPVTPPAPAPTPMSTQNPPKSARTSPLTTLFAKYRQGSTVVAKTTPEETRSPSNNCKL